MNKHFQTSFLFQQIAIACVLEQQLPGGKNNESKNLWSTTCFMFYK